MIEIITLYLKSEEFLLGTELFIRIIIAVLCGAFIGYERKNRGKGAGTRTHTIVAISQYGFADFFANYQDKGIDLKLDPSRVAAQIVSGIGFLGAGMIFIQKNVVTGLTTAAGIWATAGIGMAIGCGMYFLGITCTVIVVTIQLLMHKNPKLSQAIIESELKFTIEDDQKNVEFLVGMLEEFEISITYIGYTRKENNVMEITMTVQHPSHLNTTMLFERIYEEKWVMAAKV